MKTTRLSQPTPVLTATSCIIRLCECRRDARALLMNHLPGRLRPLYAVFGRYPEGSIRLKAPDNVVESRYLTLFHASLT